MTDAMPGNPHYGEDAPDFAATADGREVTGALLALAHEQRTANLIALLTLPRSPKGTVWDEWEAKIHASIAERLGLTNA